SENRGMLAHIEIRNFAGENGNFNVKCYQLNRPSFLVEVRTSRVLVRAGRLTLLICIPIPVLKKRKFVVVVTRCTRRQMQSPQPILDHSVS
ncbi:hypothetical protein QR685DRAFT_435579, partial [Neurospora intermedia]